MVNNVETLKTLQQLSENADECKVYCGKAQYWVKQARNNLAYDYCDLASQNITETIERLDSLEKMLVAVDGSISSLKILHMEAEEEPYTTREDKKQKGGYIFVGGPPDL